MSGAIRDWHAALMATPHARGNITLPAGIVWPNLFSNVLFVRDFYPAFFENVLEELSANLAKFRKFIVCGNPGIGKSAFGLYVLYRSVKAGRTVVYSVSKLSSAYVFKDGNIYSCTQLNTPAVHKLLSSPDTVYISDGLAPPAVDAVTLLITSPRKEVWHAFDKNTDCRMFHFPVFSLEEMEACLSTCFPLVDRPSMLQRFERWGGIPRYVLAKLETEDQAKLEAAVPRVTPALLRAHVESLEVSEKDDFSHRLLHIKTHGELNNNLDSSQPEYYLAARAELASQYVAGLLHTSLQRASEAELRRLLCDSSVIPSLGVLRGNLFEPEAVRQLSAGGRFLVRNLVDSSEKEVDFSPAKVFHFRTLDELAAHAKANPSGLHLPRSKSFCAVDAILQGGKLANMTVDLKHSIRLEGKKQPGLIGVAASLGYGMDDERCRVPFYWVVPDNLYPEFVKGASFKGKDGLRIVGGEPFVKRVVQYVICIPLSGKQGGVPGGGVQVQELSLLAKGKMHRHLFDQFHPMLPVQACVWPLDIVTFKISSLTT